MGWALQKDYDKVFTNQREQRHTCPHHLTREGCFEAPSIVACVECASSLIKPSVAECAPYTGIGAHITKYWCTSFFHSTVTPTHPPTHAPSHPSTSAPTLPPTRG